MVDLPTSFDQVPPVRVVRFRTASRAQRATGLEGWLVAEFGPIRVDGITLRRTRGGRLSLSFPQRVDVADREHAIVRPLDDAARAAIERAVFDQLDLDDGATP